MENKKYNMSFTTGGLFLRESVEVAELYLQDHDWDSVKERALEENILQFRKISSSKRSLQEILKRLWNLEEEELEFLIETNTKEQKQLLWLAICKTYRFIRDFAIEVIRDKFLRLDMEVNHADFDVFFYNKAEQDPHLDGSACVGSCHSDLWTKLSGGGRASGHVRFGIDRRQPDS